MSSNTWIKSGQVRDLLKNSITTDTGAWQYKDSPYATYQATVTGTGAVTATVVIETSNDQTNTVGTPMGTITLSGTTSASDGFTSTAPWKYVRARISAISGTGATVNVNTGT